MVNLLFGSLGFDGLVKLVGIVVAHIHLQVHVVDHPLRPLHRLREHCLRGLHEPVGLILGDGGDVMPWRHNLRLDLIPVLRN
jgi:hypothetical protein